MISRGLGGGQIGLSLPQTFDWSEISPLYDTEGHETPSSDFHHKCSVLLRDGLQMKLALSTLFIWFVRTDGLTIQAESKELDSFTGSGAILVRSDGKWSFEFLFELTSLITDVLKNTVVTHQRLQLMIRHGQDYSV